MYQKNRKIRYAITDEDLEMLLAEETTDETFADVYVLCDSQTGDAYYRVVIEAYSA